MRGNMAWLVVVIVLAAVGGSGTGREHGIAALPSPVPDSAASRAPLTKPTSAPTAKHWLSATYRSRNHSKGVGWMAHIWPNGRGTQEVDRPGFVKGEFSVPESKMVDLRLALEGHKHLEVGPRHGSGEAISFVVIGEGGTLIYDPRSVRHEYELTSARRVWAAILRVVPNPNPNDRPESWEALVPANVTPVYF